MGEKNIYWGYLAPNMVLQTTTEFVNQVLIAAKPIVIIALFLAALWEVAEGSE